MAKHLYWDTISQKIKPDPTRCGRHVVTVAAQVDQNRIVALAIAIALVTDRGYANVWTSAVAWLIAIPLAGIHFTTGQRALLTHTVDLIA